MPRSLVKKERERAWLAVVLAWVAGNVDAIGYLTLFALFTAHMSGNSVTLGFDLGQHHLGDALYRAVPVPLFVLGVTVGALVIEGVSRHGVPYTFSVTLTIEAILLIIFMTFGMGRIRNGAIHVNTAWQFYLLIALPTLSMGLQTATLRRVGGRTVRTTYVTGMLTSLAEEGAKFLVWLHDQTRGRSLRRVRRSLRVSRRQPSLNRAMLLAGIWCAYVGGAIVAGFAEQRWGLHAMIIPLCGLAFVVALDLLRPLYVPADRIAAEEP